MIDSYQTQEPKLDLEVRKQAARLGIVAGGAAVEEDPEDHIAAYFMAANWWWLATNEHDKDLRNTHIAAYKAAINSARIRSRNTISQALAELVGLELMEALPPAEDPAKTGPQEIEQARLQRLQELRSFIDQFPPLDAETQLVFDRDPAHALIRQQMPQASKQLDDTGCNYDKLTQNYQAKFRGAM